MWILLWARCTTIRFARPTPPKTSLYAYLSWITLAGLLLNAGAHLTWADPVAALGLVPIVSCYGCGTDCHPPPKALYKAVTNTVSLPKPTEGPAGGRMGTPPLRDEALLDWCTKLLGNLTKAPAPAAS